ncbi:Serine/threonine kinase [Tilletia horrida]|uniref:protein kinase C n=1 Tax=Tilletia horrida TaxID=155126 RepID=A0AAN6JTX8_9BASI|nr:Serine/threonine kinase [Tilletia horrida]KAK0556209.1 Serine/threonine kinase [Tilletia horrida]KAK0569128.1 Serine/threonine kinase [Tilletia horrida]
MADAKKISEIYAKIQTQRNTINGAQNMRRLAGNNQDAIRRSETVIRDAQANISYLESQLQTLQSRRPTPSSTGSSSATQSVDSRRTTTDSTHSGGSSSYGQHPGYDGSTLTGTPNQSPGFGPQRMAGGPMPGRDGYGPAYGPGQQQHPSAATAYGQPGGYGQPNFPPNAAALYSEDTAWQSQVDRTATTTKKAYTNLDLIKYETPLTSAKISRMLHQLEFKLQIEKQYRNGFEKMIKLYQAEGDRKSKQDAESKAKESHSKIMLLQQALKRYQQLNVVEDADDTEKSSSLEDRRRNARKPLSGTLQVSVRSARDIDHAPVHGGSRSVRETTAVIKVEDTPRARTQPTRTDRWQEDFEIAIDNGNEIEVTLYDKVSSKDIVPVGMLWVRISDIVEEMRKKKFAQPPVPPPGQPQAGTQPGGWLTADGVQQQRGPGPVTSGGGPLDVSNLSYNTPAPGYNTAAGGGLSGPEMDNSVEAWFAVEPAGAVFLRLNFVKQNVRKRPYDARLGRQGAVRKKKEDVAEINGHKFISRQFYQIIRCALCGEFLLQGQGAQCDDCRYMCHRRCAQKVVTKCISKSYAEADRDEVKINHRIPHRFEPITNVGANWCAHCGYILPLGRKNARKCSECGITCHTDCAHLVPDFCGMSMEMANQLIETLNRSKKTPKPLPTTSAQQPQAQGPQPGYNTQAGPPRIPPVGAQAGLGQPGPQPGFGQQRVQPNYGNVGVQGLEQRTQQMSIGGPRPPQDGFGSPLPPQGAQQPSAYGQPPQPQMGQSSGPNQEAYRPQGQMPPSGFGLGQIAEDPRARMQQQPQQGSAASLNLPQGPNIGRPTSPGFPQQPGGFPQQQQPLQQQRPILPPSPQPQAQPQQQVISAAQHMQAAHQQQQQQQQMAAARRNPSSRRKVGLEDFNFLAVLGKGNFGKVMLAEEKRSTKLYAIKVLKKEYIIENDEIESTKSEKRVFLAAARERHPFLVNLHSCFQTETRVYFVMEFVSGGDLMLHIQREPFTPRRAKFYATEVLLAVEHFHKQGIIYRDLKLDNILLTPDGHVKVADYGLCKEDMWRGNTTKTFCGTPEFMAPEILLEQPYGLAVDWWAFGILIYEMLLGQAPFRGDDEDEIFDAIIEDEPLYPIHMPRDSVSILQKLLTRDPARRLGSGPTDGEEIKAHPFFRDVNWDDVYHKRVPPPFCPTLSNPSDTSWFDTEFTSEKPTLTPVHTVLSPQDQAEFRNFSWTAPEIL